MDNNAQPTFATPTGMGGGVPDMGTPDQTQVQMQPPQQPQPVAPTPQQLDIHHSALFGKAAKMLLGNDNQYSVDANGNMVDTPVQQKPGQFFKNVLAAAILGGAAGANGNPAQGFAGGFARGSAVGLGQQQQQDLMKRQQAEQQFKDQQTAAQQDQQRLSTQATVEHMHALTANLQRTSDLLSEEAHQKNNASSRALEGVLIQAGGKLSPIVVDGKPTNGVMTAPALAQAVVSDPSVLKAPEGYQRHFLDTSDSSDVKFNGKQWVQDDGTPVNMTDKTTIKAYDVPIDSLNTAQDVKGSVLLAANPSLKGSIDPDKIYPTTPNQVTTLRGNFLAQQQKQALADAETARARTAAGQLSVSQRELALKEKKEARESGEQGLAETSLSHLVTPTNVGADGINHAFLTNAEQIDPRRAALIRQIGEGRATVSSFGLARKEGQALLEDVNAAYPNYDSGRAKQYETTLKEFGPSGKSGKTLQAGGTALEHLGRLYDSVGALQTMPGLKTLGDYIQQDKSGKYATNSGNAAQEIGTFYANGGAAHADDVEGYRHAYTGTPDKVRSAVKQQAINMMDKIKEIAASYDSNVPSTFVRPQTFLSPEAAQAYTRVTGEPVDPSLIRHGDIIGQQSHPVNNHEDQAARQPGSTQPPTGAVSTGKGSDGKTYYLDANHNPIGIVQ